MRGTSYHPGKRKWGSCSAFQTLKSYQCSYQLKTTASCIFCSLTIRVCLLFFSLFSAQFFHPCLTSEMVSTGCGHTRERAQLSPLGQAGAAQGPRRAESDPGKGSAQWGVSPSHFAGCFAPHGYRVGAAALPGKRKGPRSTY